MGAIDPHAYRSFNLVIADDRDAYWLAARNGAMSVEVYPVPEGISILTSQDLNTENAPRIGTFRPLFQAATVPDPATGDWHEWERLIASGLPQEDAAFDEAMTIVTDRGYGTVSSSLIALPRHEPGAKTRWRFAAGRPGEIPYEQVLP